MFAPFSGFMLLLLVFCSVQLRATEVPQSLSEDKHQSADREKPRLALSENLLVKIPGGQIEAIWQSPISKSKNNKVATKAKRGDSGVQKRFVQVSPFFAQSHAVTVYEFKKFLKSHSEWEREKAAFLFKDDYYLKELDSAEDHSPVTFVSWFAARAYCTSLGMRLPSVNQWEYMAAASENKKDANRDEHFLKRILEWYGEPQGGKIKPVQSIYKNMYGLWDMHGLIWEWVDDFNSNFVTGESREDSSFNKDMFCGAGALSSADKENYAAFMRFAFRSSLKGKSSVWNLGFRCIK